jgi:hypothetical protein
MIKTQALLTPDLQTGAHAAGSARVKGIAVLERVLITRSVSHFRITEARGGSVHPDFEEIRS